MIIVASYYFSPKDIRRRISRYSGDHEIIISSVVMNNEFSVLHPHLESWSLDQCGVIIFCNDTIFKTGRTYMIDLLLKCEEAYRKVSGTTNILELPVVWGSWFLPTRSPYFSKNQHMEIRSDIFAFNRCYGKKLYSYLSILHQSPIDERDLFFIAYDFHYYNKGVRESLGNYNSRKVVTQAIESSLAMLAVGNNGVTINVQSLFRSCLEKISYQVKKILSDFLSR